MFKTRYNKLNHYLTNKFGSRTLKICVDGYFSCPNRTGEKGLNGCIFCSTAGSGDLINSKPTILEQITNYLSSYKATRAGKFIVYFQAFSNTYDSVDNLKKKYYEAINADDRIVGLDIATRPDCINNENVKLLSEINKIKPVTVEFGLQTANDDIGKIINRCYTTDDFITAVNLLHKYNIEVVAHIMVGLPNETETDILNTVDLINKLNIEGIKIHSTYVLKNTKLCEMFNQGKYTPLTQEYYVKMVAKIISRLNPNIIIHRLTGDPPKELLVAPEWTKHKKIVLNAIEQTLENADIFQGKEKDLR